MPGPIVEQRQVASLPPRPPMRIAEAGPDGLEAKCRPERRRACLQAKAYPDEPLEWELSVQPICDGRDCPPGTREVALLELVSMLLVHGADDLFIVGRRAVITQLSHDDVLAAARLGSVTSVDVRCSAATEFCSCADLPPDRCEEHAFCRQLLGQAVGDTCISPDQQPIGCSGHTIVESVQSDAIAPDGRRWRLPTTTIPSAPGWRRAVDQSELQPCSGD